MFYLFCVVGQFALFFGLPYLANQMKGTMTRKKSRLSSVSPVGFLPPKRKDDSCEHLVMHLDALREETVAVLDNARVRIKRIYGFVLFCSLLKQTCSNRNRQSSRMLWPKKVVFVSSLLESIAQTRWTCGLDKERTC